MSSSDQANPSYYTIVGKKDTNKSDAQTKCQSNKAQSN